MLFKVRNSLILVRLLGYHIKLSALFFYELSLHLGLTFF